MPYKLNPFTGTLDFYKTSSSASSSDNFSYDYIQTGVTVTIPTNQQMLYVGPITIDGTLIVDGKSIEV